MTEGAARDVTLSDVVILTAYLVLEDPFSAAAFCNALLWLASFGGASSCEIIKSAGCIPIIIADCLRRWLADGHGPERPEGVVFNARRVRRCTALGCTVRLLCAMPSSIFLTSVICS